METSLMFGIFSSMQGPSARITAGIMATTAVFCSAYSDLALKTAAALYNKFFQNATLL